MKKPIPLKLGIIAEAEIITQDAIVIQRLTRNFFKMIGYKSKISEIHLTAKMEYWIVDPIDNLERPMFPNI